MFWNQYESAWNARLMSSSNSLSENLDIAMGTESKPKELSKSSNEGAKYQA